MTDPLLRVLVADDLPDQVATMRLLLRTWECVVRTALDGRKALAAALPPGLRDRLAQPTFLSREASITPVDHAPAPSRPNALPGPPDARGQFPGGWGSMQRGALVGGRMGAAEACGQVV